MPIIPHLQEGSDTFAEGKFDFDVIGHYARNDVFSFAVNEAPQTSTTDIRDVGRVETPASAALSLSKEIRDHSM